MNDSPCLSAGDRDVYGGIICRSGVFRSHDSFSWCLVSLFQAPISLGDSAAFLADSST